MADAVSEEKDIAEEEVDLLDFLIINSKPHEVEKKQEGRRIGKYDEQKEDSECPDQNAKNVKKRHLKDLHLHSEIFLDFFKEYDAVDLEKLDVDTFADQCFSLLESLAMSELATDRQLAVEKLLPYLSLVDKTEEKINKALPIFCNLSEDKELSVRCCFIDMIPQLVLFCKENHPFANNVVKQILVPYALKCFTSTQLLVRQVGHASLTTLMENNLIENSQLSEWVCPFVAQCIIASDNSIEIQKEDLYFMNKILPFIGKDLAVRFFLEPFIAMCAKPDKEIRKVCASNLLTYAHFVGEELSDSPLLLSFIDLCNDHENKDVCVLCIEVFAEISRLVSMKVRKELLTNVFMRLLESGVADVMLSASQELGSFIFTFATSSDCRWKPSRQTGNTDELLSNERQISASCKGLATHNSVFSSTNSDKNHSTPVSISTSDRNLNFPSNRNENFISGDTVDSLKKMYGLLQNELIKCKQKDINENLPSDMNLRQDELNWNNFSETGTVSCSEKDTNHINEHMFNSFQYWKFPLPEIEMEMKDHLQNNIFSSKTSVISQTVDRANISVPVRKTEGAFVIEIKCKVQPKPFRYRSNKMVGHTLHRIIRKKLRNLAESQDIIPPDLLDLYLRLIHNTTHDYYEQCVRSFPAVVCTIGKKYWFIVREAFLDFARCGQFNIRRTFASCFHELVMILDQETFNEDLLLYFKNILEDDDDEVCYKVIEHLSAILIHGGNNARSTFSSAMKFLSLEKSGRNWRFEFTLAEQLCSVIELFDTKEVNEIYLPYALDLLKNKISVIRQAAVELLSIILKYLFTDKATYDFVTRTLCTLVEDYKNAQKWNWRQLYVNFSEQIAIKQALSMDTYVEKIVPHLLALAWDSVPNVRLSVARCLVRSLVPLGYFPSIEGSHGPLLTQVLFSLRSDIERDVRNFAVLLPILTIDSKEQEAIES